MTPNVRRYVQLSQLRSGMCFCRLAWRAQSFSILLMVIRGKNHDTRRESPAGAGAACTALVMNFGSYLNRLLIKGLLTCFLQLRTSRGTEGNCIYRPVMPSCLSLRGYILFFVTLITPISIEFDSTPTILACPPTALKFHVLV